MEVGQTISQQCQPCGSFLWETDKFLGGCSCSCSLSHQRAGLSDKTICWKNPARDPRAKKTATSCRKARLVKLVATSPTLGVNSTCTQSTRRRVCHWLVKKALPAILPERPPPKRLRASRHCWKICRRIAVGSHRCLALLIPRRKALLDAPLVILDTFRSPVFNQSPRHGASRESNTRRTHR
jgi:hypothetical protein